MLGKIEGRRRRGRQRMRWLDDITDSMDTEFEQTPEDGEVQRSLASCSPWGCKELDLSERLNNNSMESGSTCFLLVESQKNIQNSTKSL